VSAGIIEGNSVYNNTNDGIIIGAGAVINNSVFNNTGAGINIGSGTVENNFVSNNTGALGVGIKIGNGLVQNNTISNNHEGLVISSSAAIIYNNIQNNFWSVDLGSGIANNKNPNDINATCNWWGTTDPSEIDQSIYDSKNDFRSGTVNFVPFLTESNSQAPQAAPYPNRAMAPSTLTQSPSPSPAAVSAPTPTPIATPAPITLPLAQTSQQQTHVFTVVAIALMAIATWILSIVAIALIAFNLGSLLLGMRSRAKKQP
jgi:hypothetical protein